MEQIEDTRPKLWSELEAKIQARALNKDLDFILTGPWKNYLREQEGFKVYLVDGEWIRNNISVIFNHGGHGYVHEFIPLDEIWVGTSHHQECNCDAKKVAVSKKYMESTIIHEITEYRLMANGMQYWQAHNIALDEERKAGFLADPYKDDN
jgi:hypothetical protein